MSGPTIAELTAPPTGDVLALRKLMFEPGSLSPAEIARLSARFASICTDADPQGLWPKRVGAFRSEVRRRRQADPLGCNRHFMDAFELHFRPMERQFIKELFADFSHHEIVEGQRIHPQRRIAMIKEIDPTNHYTSVIYYYLNLKEQQIFHGQFTYGGSVCVDPQKATQSTLACRSENSITLRHFEGGKAALFGDINGLVGGAVWFTVNQVTGDMDTALEWGKLANAAAGLLKKRPARGSNPSSSPTKSSLDHGVQASSFTRSTRAPRRTGAVVQDGGRAPEGYRSVQEHGLLPSPKDLPSGANFGEAMRAMRGVMKLRTQKTRTAAPRRQTRPPASAPRIGGADGMGGKGGSKCFATFHSNLPPEELARMPCVTSAPEGD